MDFVKNPRGDGSEKADRVKKTRAGLVFQEFIEGCGIYIDARLTIRPILSAAAFALAL
jgi:hypothetical protein